MDYLQTLGIQRWQKNPVFFDKTQSANELTNQRASELDVDVDGQIIDTAAVLDDRDSVNGEVNAETNVEARAESALNKKEAQQDSSVQKSELDAVSPIAQAPKEQSYEELQAQQQNGQLCTSCASQGSLSGEGSNQAKWVFVCEEPTANNLQHQSFYQGRSGQLLEAILAAIGLDKGDVYVTSLNKCIKQNNQSDSTRQCRVILEAEIKHIGADYIVGFGESVTQYLLKRNDTLDVLCQQIHTHIPTGAKFVPSYALTQLLEQPKQKRITWHNLCDAMQA